MNKNKYAKSLEQNDMFLEKKISDLFDNDIYLKF